VELRRRFQRKTISESEWRPCGRCDTGV